MLKKSVYTFNFLGCLLKEKTIFPTPPPSLVESEGAWHGVPLPGVPWGPVTPLAAGVCLGSVAWVVLLDLIVCHVS